jgi:hypothetical protein
MRVVAFPVDFASLRRLPDRWGLAHQQLEPSAHAPPLPPLRAESVGWEYQGLAD